MSHLPMRSLINTKTEHPITLTQVMNEKNDILLMLVHIIFYSLIKYFCSLKMKQNSFKNRYCRL